MEATKWPCAFDEGCRGRMGRSVCAVTASSPAGWIRRWPHQLATTFSCGRKSADEISVAGRSAGWLDRPRSHRWPCTSARTSRRIARAPSSSSMASHGRPAYLDRRQSDVRRREAMAKRIVVVGAGSAGCVVAARLSENVDKRRRAAGGRARLSRRAHGAGRYPQRFRDGRQGTRLGYLSEPIAGAAAVTPGSDGGVIPMLRGKVVGGSSSVNGAAIRRPRPSDFDAWIAAGNLSELGASPTRAPRVGGHPAGGEYHGCGGPCTSTGLRADDASGASAVLGRMPGPRFLWSRTTTLPIRSAPAHPLELGRRSPAERGRHASERGAGRPNLTVRSGVMADRIHVVNGRARGVQLTNGERNRCRRGRAVRWRLWQPGVLMPPEVRDRALLRRPTNETANCG